MERLLFILATVCCLTVKGQSALTLDSCISYAIGHSNAIGQRRIEREQSRYEEKVARLSFLPTVQGQVSGQFAWGRNIDPETNTYNTITTFNNYYTVEASVSLFDGGQTINAFRRARNQRLQSQSELQKAADDKAMAVMTKFVDAIYNQKSVALAEEKLADSRALLHKTERLYQLGEKSRPDVVQMESQEAEDEYNLLHQCNQSRLALMALSSEMNWTEGDSLVLVANDCSVGGSTVETIAQQPTPVMVAQQKATDLQYAWKIARGQLVPTLSVGAGVQTSFYRNISQGGDGAGPFGRQFHNNLGEYVYASLSIPIFTPSRWRTARRAKAEWQKARMEVDDARRKWHDDRLQAMADRDGYQKEVAQMMRKVAADSLAYHLSKRKYEEGMLSTFDLYTSAQTLLQSRIKLLQARLLLAIKEKLVRYYNGEPLWTLK